MSLLEFTPTFSSEDIIRLANEQFGLTVDALRRLPGERDQNFLITEPNQQQWVLKACNAQEDPEFLQAQQRMMGHLAQRLTGIPRCRPTPHGDALGCATAGSRQHLLRVVEFLPGRPLADIRFRSPTVLQQLGRKVGSVTAALQDFTDPALERAFLWDLRTAPAAIRQRFSLLPVALQPVVTRCLQDCEQFVMPRTDQLRCSVIHNDANDGNVIVAPRPHAPGEFDVTGLIDYGDALFSWTVADLAVAIAYAIFDTQDPLQAAQQILTGYVQTHELNEAELEVLFPLIRLRLCLSAAVAAEQSQLRPEDEYLTVSQAPLQRVLPQLDAVPHRIATELFRLCTPLDERSEVQAFHHWLRTTDELPSSALQLPADATLRAIDLSAGSPLLTGRPATWTPASLQAVIDDYVQPQEIATGRYLEPRLLYADEHFSSTADTAANAFATERRTVHLGIDLFAPAGTPVCAVLEGIVERVDACPEPLDYGTLIILKHEPAPGVCFYSLYGHLSSACRGLVAGTRVQRGEVIAELGAVNDNGGWPPHLHFQLATDLLQTARNFPGVCRASETRAWASICPDPSPVFGPQAFHCQPAGFSETQVHARRQRNTPAALRLSYQQPLHMVRGHDHFLYAASGHRYLDAYNNVPHVGHCHPRIVRALSQQASLLNTNTRYLHDLSSDFAEELAATLPDPLCVCVFVNSASEANELALRLARAATGGHDLIVLEGAYHGHSTTLIDISPYKHSGPGGTGAPDWVHTAAVADVYRGPHRDIETAGSLYAQDVRQIIAGLQQRGRRLSGFIAESCPSVGGQIIFPPHYLSDVYAAVRAAGGLCIADEVQTGYGRLGEYFYGFEQQQVVPDVVVLGKPIGNGHPLAAVVTTPEIAAAFDTGMEFFSTFGGNTVSCAVGREVLRTVQQEQLPQNAATVGQYLLAEFRRLAQEQPLIGDVRGSGLFLGIELVEDPSTLAPAAWQATFLVERMKEQGVLMGTDGPLHNVLKIRPPMTFDLPAAKTLVAALSRAFEQLPVMTN